MEQRISYIKEKILNNFTQYKTVRNYFKNSSEMVLEKLF